jgi:hypothetical protein
MTATTFIRVLFGFALCSVSPAAEEPPAQAIQDNSFLVEEAYNQEAGVVQHILAAQYSRAGSELEWDLAFTQEWPLFSQRHQVSYTVPYSFLRADGDRKNGPGDVLLNYRFQALFENDDTPAFAPRLSLILPTGDADKGLSNDAIGGQLNLPLSKIVGERWTVHANVGATVFPDANDHTLHSYNIGASAIYAVRRDLNLMLECVGNFDDNGVDEFGETDRSSSVVLSPGFRYAFNHPTGAQTVVGVAAPIGLTRDAPDYGVFFYFSFEHAFLSGVGIDKSGKR